MSDPSPALQDNKSSVGLTILGSTGTIGVNTLDVISRHKNRYHVVGLTAHQDVERLVSQCMEFHPKYAVIADDAKFGELSQHIRTAGLRTELMCGSEGLQYVASCDDTQYVMAGIVGAAGLLPTLAAARSGKRVLLANKEALVMSGKLFIDEVRKNGAELLPIDSEHNAIFQCMPAGFENGLAQVAVERILLTASGGPFRETPLEKLKDVTPDEACAHPNWVMGRKISVDSATMMNKGLEIIEACWLFNTDAQTIQVVIHPQSIIHSMVAYSDGSVLAELGNPDMRTPIAHALAWPERFTSGVEPLDLYTVAQLDFQMPDLQRYPCLQLAYAAIEAGGTSTTALNAANEVAVQAFLQEQICFTDIARVIEYVLEEVTPTNPDNLEIILQVDELARQTARERIRAFI